MAYALVVSLKRTLEPLLDSSRSRNQIPNSEVNLIYDYLCYLKSFFDKMSSLEDSNSVEEVEKQIKEVLQNSEDLIEFHLPDLVDSGSDSVLSGELEEVNQNLGSLIKVLKAKEDHLTGEQQQQQSGAGFGRNDKIVGLADSTNLSSKFDFGRNNYLFGMDRELLDLKDRLLGDRLSLKVISIVGMAGSGKTTLAREVYLDRLIAVHYHVRLFVQIGLEFQLKNLLLSLVGQLDSKEWGQTETVGNLGDHLHKYLFGRKYLIVFDDMWDARALQELLMFFPENNNGSRIMLTTRNANVACILSGQKTFLQKRLLDSAESWELLCKMTFTDMEECPLELEEIGKTIAENENLGGLPLAIVEIGNLLCKLERTPGNWIAVAQNIDSILQESTIPTIIKTSYSELPQQLKACFLYLGAFQPNYSIPTSQLIKLWVAEGFIEPVADHQSLEKLAEEYLQDLISRSLVMVHELGSTGRIKTCRIHKLFQLLCVAEARQEKLFHIVKQSTTSSRKGNKNQRRLFIQQNDVALGALELVSGVRSLVFICPKHQHPLHAQVFLRLRWLKVLDAVSIRFWKFPDGVTKLVRLRYLAITCDGELPSSISALWNLEVLIIHPTQSQTINSSAFLPIEIWELHKLRHLHCMGFDLPDPFAAATRCGDHLLLDKLLTLSGVSARSCTEGVLSRMPNLIKLGIRSEATENAVEMSCFDAVYTNLHRLESFKCAVMNRGVRSEAAISLIGFPSGLRKLSLSGCGFLWDQHMPIISRLPLLQVLKLRWLAFCGNEWELFDEPSFSSLKHLVLEDLDIERFILADSSNFPCLQQLHVRRCHKLLEIPLDFAEIPTLKIIVLDSCHESAVMSAKRIVEEQEELYGEESSLLVHVGLSDKNEAIQALASPNFHIQILSDER